jgi:hypothetical protein
VRSAAATACASRAAAASSYMVISRSCSTECESSSCWRELRSFASSCIPKHIYTHNVHAHHMSAAAAAAAATAARMGLADGPVHTRQEGVLPTPAHAPAELAWRPPRPPAPSPAPLAAQAPLGW